MDSEVERFKLGDFECLVFKDGGGPRVATQFLNEAPPDELERIVREHGLDPQAVPFSINILLIKTGDQTVLFDTGLGPNASNLPDKLRAEGVDPESVTLIVITHGHWDHIGGILGAEREFLYPNARYVLSKAEWDYWTAPDRFAESPENPAKVVWESLFTHRDRVTMLDLSTGDAEIIPGLCAIAAPGHTVGHMAVMLDSNGQKMLHIADAAHQNFQLDCPQWSPPFDQDKVESVKSRRALFQRAAKEHSLLYAYHFPFPGTGYVDDHAGRWVWRRR
jgi:glyoxylase-like metal-dependent hydrolase (beta-lactamase superfamily II)